jgi:hypothetical protein
VIAYGKLSGQLSSNALQLASRDHINMGLGAASALGLASKYIRTPILGMIIVCDTSCNLNHAVNLISLLLSTYLIHSISSFYSPCSILCDLGPYSRHPSPHHRCAIQWCPGSTHDLLHRWSRHACSGHPAQFLQWMGKLFHIYHFYATRFSQYLCIHPLPSASTYPNLISLHINRLCALKDSSSTSPS